MGTLIQIIDDTIVCVQMENQRLHWGNGVHISLGTNIRETEKQRLRLRRLGKQNIIETLNGFLPNRSTW